MTLLGSELFYCLIAVTFKSRIYFNMNSIPPHPRFFTIFTISDSASPNHHHTTLSQCTCHYHVNNRLVVDHDKLHAYEFRCLVIHLCITEASQCHRSICLIPLNSSLAHAELLASLGMDSSPGTILDKGTYRLAASCFAD